jgi:hypothetical protein
MKGTVNICNVGILHVFMRSNESRAFVVSCRNKLCTQHIYNGHLLRDKV